MDNTIIDKLGNAGPQLILAVIVVALGTVLYKIAMALKESYDGRLSETRDIIKQQSSDVRMVTEALRDMKTTIDLLVAKIGGK